LSEVVRRGPYPELTLTSVLVGYGIGALITISIAYSSLVLGFSTDGSAIAAILGWGVLRGVMRRTSIVENSINQTVASAVNGASAGMMFSVPALFILEDRVHGLSGFSPWSMVPACITGGVLGIAFLIPLRKQMIDYDRLTYPGGLAVAAILKSPGTGIVKARAMIAAAIVSGIFLLVVRVGLGIDDDTLELTLPGGLYLPLFLSLMTVGIGFLSGRGGLLFGVSGIACYWGLLPLLGRVGDGEVRAWVAAGAIGRLREALFMPAGVGVLVGAAIGGVIAAYPLIRSGLSSLRESSHTGLLSGPDELSIRVLYAGVMFGAISLSVLGYFASPEMTPLRAVVMMIVALMWIWIAGGIASECLGRTNWAPLSGMTLIAVTILMFVGSGMSARHNVMVAVVIGAATSIGIAQAGELMLDLKAGHLCGATPKRQQIAQLCATWLGPILVVGLIYVLHRAYGLGSGRLPSPQGKALAEMIAGILGGDVFFDRYLAGAGIGFAMALSGLAGIGAQLGLGFYAPFGIVLTFTCGGSLRLALERACGPRWCEDTGVPIAAGLIVGEALAGVSIALMKLAEMR
jgi:putative OPT family oligopeptide transporter